LAALQQGRDWYWILGNHDPDLPESIGGFVCRSLMIGGITLCHQPSLSRAPEIAGHLHPVARIARRGEGIRRKCFATDGHRLVMPAFGAYAGGLNVLDEAFSPLFHWHLMEAWLTGRTSVYRLEASLLLPD
jgi:metallophosphoesterase superfamily enzyme